MTEFLSTGDRWIAMLAGRQHGVVTAAQLAEAGIDKDGIACRRRTGRLHRLHRGVYAVGHRSLSWRGRWLAAVLASGDGAVLSHTSAAALWGFLRPIPGPVHVTVAAATRRKPRAGIVAHRSRTITRSHVTRRHDIAVTTPARTIEDIRTTIQPYLFRRALRQAELAGHRVPHLSVTKRTRSDLELLFLRLCHDHGLPRPLVNRRVHGYRVDFWWPDHRLAVETDSWEYHRGSVALEDDHVRDLALRARGIETRRYTGDQLEAAPEAVVADLRATFAAAPAPLVTKMQTP
ncbi:MAG TPA: type IV toxin-antitoxin system AbiEi family antitoxin domain-containing protein [Solirubrobacterales bacterium]|nr:type IV toxin-antitoxin system AbiEi family antitoxin domain-containing protein [Solirubrobacterales bacterium]